MLTLSIGTMQTGPSKQCRPKSDAAELDLGLNYLPLIQQFSGTSRGSKMDVFKFLTKYSKELVSEYKVQKRWSFVREQNKSTHHAIIITVDHYWRSSTQINIFFPPISHLENNF